MMYTRKGNLFLSPQPLLEEGRKEIFDVTFWGVRGVHPCSGKDYHRFGGHTICTSFMIKSEKHQVPLTHLIFDAGSGLASLGQHLVNHVRPHRLMLFFSHVHLDHIMGIPFFLPFWRPEWETTLFCGHMEKFGGIQSYLDQLFSPPLFPVPFRSFPGGFQFENLEPGQQLSWGDIKMETFALNHPDEAIGCRVSFANKHACYVTDTEHVPNQPDPHILKGIRQADLVIYDSTYTDEIWPTKIGWGHSTWQEGIRLARQAEVKHLALYHHEPTQTDHELEKLEKEAQHQWENVFSARQSTTVCLLDHPSTASS